MVADACPRAVLKKMLCPDPKGRMFTEDVLKDPWFLSTPVCGACLLRALTLLSPADSRVSPPAENGNAADGHRHLVVAPSAS